MPKMSCQMYPGGWLLKDTDDNGNGVEYLCAADGAISRRLTGQEEWQPTDKSKVPPLLLRLLQNATAPV